VYSGLGFADPRPHERVAVVGIGALGHLGIQYSKAAGFETIAVTHLKISPNCTGLLPSYLG
jgi:alcohol dehydrogenase